MPVEATDADRELFVKLTGYDSNSIDAILGGSAFTWEVEQIARHRIAERERVVGEIVAWLRGQINGYFESAGYEHAACFIEAKFGGRDA